MPRYMVQASHAPSPRGCLRVLDGFPYGGTHFLANVEWGCQAGVDTAWTVGGADDDRAARPRVPAVVRNEATVVRLDWFTPGQIRGLHQREVL